MRPPRKSVFFSDNDPIHFGQAQQQRKSVFLKDVVNSGSRRGTYLDAGTSGGARRQTVAFQTGRTGSVYLPATTVGAPRKSILQNQRKSVVQNQRKSTFLQRQSTVPRRGTLLDGVTNLMVPGAASRRRSTAAPSVRDQSSKPTVTEIVHQREKLRRSGNVADVVTAGYVQPYYYEKESAVQAGPQIRALEQEENIMLRLFKTNEMRDTMSIDGMSFGKRRSALNDNIECLLKESQRLPHSSRHLLERTAQLDVIYNRLLLALSVVVVSLIVTLAILYSRGIFPLSKYYEKLELEKDVNETIHENDNANETGISKRESHLTFV